MKRISESEAKAAGYRSITTPINLTTEAYIVEAIERDMRGCDAIWIFSPEVKYPPPKHDVPATVQCARKSTEIISIERP